jgi:GNAT superfamily N-acetyltransferase
MRSLMGSRPSLPTASPEAHLSAIWRRSHTSKPATHSKPWPPRSSRTAGCFLAAFAEGRLVGTVQVNLALPPNQPHRAEIAKLLVHRSARKRGVAQLLMEHAESEARAAGKTLLVLDTVTGGDGERLYARLGWTKVGVIPGYALFPDGRPCDTTVFWKTL